MIDHLITEHTTGTIVGPDGRPLSMPTRILTSEDATTMRGYFFWALTSQLEPELFCTTCEDKTRDSMAVYDITEQQIVITCRCRIRFFQGLSILPTFNVRSYASYAGPPESDGVGLVRLSTDVALLLRQYKKVLLRLGLKEALRCQACFELHGASRDGCHASVTNHNIRITCRCTRRTFTGWSD